MAVMYNMYKYKVLTAKGVCYVYVPEQRKALVEVAIREVHKTPLLDSIYLGFYRHVFCGACINRGNFLVSSIL